MLSYQHAYHAGNAADLHKHVALAALLDYLGQKPKALSYVETHAGRGLYRLDGVEAARTGEAAAGIGRLAGRLAADEPFAQVLAGVRARHGAAAYPGSPLIAAALCREGDTIHLAELHPQEHAALLRAMAGLGAHVYREDGWALVRRLVPPMPRRGLVLIDPSWELREDYAEMPGRIAAIHRRWPVGVVMLWYPLLTDGRHRSMIAALAAAVPGLVRHEVAFAPARAGHGMVGSGLALVNPPHVWEGVAARLTALFAKG
ncbi:MAG: 23S rRNA (adenine(2030)-N(6))-methyltransferase RlmJ [Gemmobacter sp.]